MLQNRMPFLTCRPLARTSPIPAPTRTLPEYSNVLYSTAIVGPGMEGILWYVCKYASLYACLVCVCVSGAILFALWWKFTLVHSKSVGVVCQENVLSCGYTVHQYTLPSIPKGKFNNLYATVGTRTQTRDSSGGLGLGVIYYWIINAWFYRDVVYFFSIFR